MSMKPGRKPLSKDVERRGKRLARIVKAERNKKGLSQQELADRSKVAYATLRRIESAETLDAGFFTVADIALALGLKLEDLAGRPKPA